jgi:hypothetical protein
MGVDPFAILSGLISIVIIGLLIWICITVYKWYKNPRLAPSFIQNIYYYFYPRSYDQAKGFPLDMEKETNKTKWIQVKNSTLSNCMSNCNMTVGCNAFVYSESFTACVYENESAVNESTILIQPGSVFSDAMTYVSTDSAHPAYSYNIYSNINYASQTSNILSISGDYFKCAEKCSETSNCVAFSIPQSQLSANCTLVSTTSSNVASSGAVSFVFEPAVFSLATFES